MVTSPALALRSSRAIMCFVSGTINQCGIARKNAGPISEPFMAVTNAAGMFPSAISRSHRARNAVDGDPFRMKGGSKIASLSIETRGERRWEGWRHERRHTDWFTDRGGHSCADTTVGGGGPQP